MKKTLITILALGLFFACFSQTDSLKNASLIGQSTRNQKVGQGLQVGFVGSSDDTLQINTKMQLLTGSPGVNKVLRSDANGFATWVSSLSTVVATNGLTESGDSIELGGPLNKPTTIELDTFTIGFVNTDNSIIFAVGKEANGITAVGPLVYAEATNIQLSGSENITLGGGALLANNSNFELDSLNCHFELTENPYATTSGNWYFESHNAGAIASLSLNGSDVNSSAVGLINRDTVSNPNETRDWGFGNYQNENVYGANMFYWVQPRHPDSTGRDIGYIGVFKSKLDGLPFATVAVATDSTEAAGVFAQMNYATDHFGYGLTGAQPFQVSTSGSVKIQDGTQGAGKTLTSDASGNASWGGDDALFVIDSVATTGDTVELGLNTYTAIMASGAITNLVLRFPALPLDGDVVTAKFDFAVTTLSSDGQGKTINGFPSSTVLGQHREWRYNATTGAWY